MDVSHYYFAFVILVLAFQLSMAFYIHSLRVSLEDVLFIYFLAFVFGRICWSGVCESLLFVFCYFIVSLSVVNGTISTFIESYFRGSFFFF